MLCWSTRFALRIATGGQNAICSPSATASSIRSSGGDEPVEQADAVRLLGLDVAAGEDKVGRA